MFTTIQKNFHATTFPTQDMFSDNRDAQKLAAWMDAFDAIGHAALVIGRSHRVTYHNQAFSRMVENASTDLHLGKDLFTLLVELFGKHAAASITACIALREHNSRNLQAKVYSKGIEKTYAVSISSVPGGSECHASLVITFQDISSFTQQLAYLEHKASHDPLTGVPNRWMLDEILENAIGVSSRNGHQLQVVYLDLNNFKSINDAYGHQAGDQVLRAVAFQIRDSLRQGDTIARVGGDEFVLVLHRGCSPSENVLTRIQENLAAGIDVGEKKIAVSCSFGISTFPQDGRTSHSLLEIADQRMYAQKKFS